MAFEGGPYVAAAFFCHTVLQEAGGLYSFIRVVDRITVHGAGPAISETMPALPIGSTLVLVFKADKARGRKQLTIRPESPSGLKGPAVLHDINLEGEERGVILSAPITLQTAEEGLYWFDILIDDQVITRVPLRVVYQRSTLGPRGGRSRGE